MVRSNFKPKNQVTSLMIFSVNREEILNTFGRLIADWVVAGFLKNEKGIPFPNRAILGKLVRHAPDELP